MAEAHLCMGCYVSAAGQDSIRDPQGKTMDGTTVKLILNTPQKRAEAAERARRIREGLDQE